MEEPIQSVRKAAAILLDDVRQQNANSVDPVDLYKAAFFCLTRILLICLWESSGLLAYLRKSMPQRAPAPGYENENGIPRFPCEASSQYEALNREIDRALRDVFHLTDDGESWLFNRENDYTWYCPGVSALNNVLNELSCLNWSNSDTDILGIVYEEYIDRTDRKNKGQYYTPQEVVSFIWNRVGLKEESDFFHHVSGRRWPKLIFDPAAGSGGFLVEATRRLRANLDGDHHKSGDLLAIKNAFGSFHGSEIQPFPHYIAQVNLLIQLTSIIKELNDSDQLDPEGFTFSVVNRDSLSLQKQKPKFDYVCSNPPFIGEKGNKALFSATVGKYPYWKQYYQGKMDYFYWFIILGLSELKEGGKLCFITTSYWLTADGAAGLRQYILDHALIREIISLGETPIFKGAPGQHNMIFVLERSTDSRRRAANRIKTARVKKSKTKLKSLLDHLEKHIEGISYSDKLIDVFVSPMIQGDLTSEAWNLFHPERTDKTLKKIVENSTPLGQLCYINQGIISGADKVTRGNIKLLPVDLITKHKIKIGDGIFVLNKEELESLHLNSREMALIKRFCKNSDIERYRISPKTRRFLIYTTKETDIDSYPGIKSHLERFRPILENKRECREGKLPWFSLHWPRNTAIFEGAKIVTPNRAVKNTFALSELPLYAMSDVFFIAGRNHKDSLNYVLAILNSSLVDFWFSRTRKGKGRIREYVGTPLSQVPIRQIDFDNSKEKAVHNRLAALASEITTVKASEERAMQREIDAKVLDLYGLKSIDIML